jgi:hypothetical protein
MKRKASDGLPARSGRIWTQEKLTFLKKYASAFMTAMAGKWKRLVYIDLLAGPGRDIDPETGEEFAGSPLIALEVNPKFHHLFLCDNNSANIAALDARILAADRARVTIQHWGGQDWRELSDWREFVMKYRRKLLHAGFKCEDEAVPLFKNTKNAQMYHRLYFSHHQVGLKLWRGVGDIEPGGQRKLPI